MPSKKSQNGRKKATSSTSSKKSRSTTGGSTRKTTARSSGSAQPLTDHKQIRQWAEARGAVPSCVKGTGSSEDVGMIRLDFPGYSGEESLQEISWDEWFEKFDENGLALMVQEKTSRGQQSNFNKLVKRTTAQKRPKTRAAG